MKELISKIDGLWTQYSRLSGDIRKVCEEFITRAVKEADGKRINLNDGEDCGDYCYVTYDGGNHPEYASGFSQALYAEYNEKDDCVYIECENGSEELSYFSTDDMLEIYLFVKYHVMKD